MCFGKLSVEQKNKAIEKFKAETGQAIIQNTNRKNYESLAILLSDISNQLPTRFEEFGAESYSIVLNQQSQEYPHRKYDITGGQIKDALIGIVANPRPFLVDACYIYLYGIGRKAFKQNPVDDNLLELSAEDKKEEVLFMNRAVNHFAKNDTFNEGNFMNDVISNPDLVPEFNHYKSETAPKYKIEDLTTFPIANTAVTAARKKIKNREILFVKICTKFQL